jgi:hypothetical protein
MKFLSVLFFFATLGIVVGNVCEDQIDCRKCVEVGGCGFFLMEGSEYGICIRKVFANLDRVVLTFRSVRSCSRYEKILGKSIFILWLLNDCRYIGTRILYVIYKNLNNSDELRSTTSHPKSILADIGRQDEIIPTTNSVSTHTSTTPAKESIEGELFIN